MDYTILLRSLSVVQFSPVKSALYVLARSPGLKLCKTTKMDKGVQCKRFPGPKQGAPKVYCLQQTVRRLICARRGGVFQKHAKLACLIKTGVFVSKPRTYGGRMCQILSMQSIYFECVFFGLCAESFFTALCSTFWSPRNVFLLPFLLQRSRDLMKTILSLTGPQKDK